MKRIFVIIGIVAIGLSSCDKERPDTGGTNAQKMANEWWVQLYDPSGALVYPASYHGHMATYNSASNDNTIWIDDFPHISGTNWTGDIWAFKFKAVADLNSMTFAANQSASDLVGRVGSTPVEYKLKVNVTEGKILEDAGKSRTGVVTDSIYMKIEFSDDPATIYSIRGHARTRFSEDDY